MNRGSIWEITLVSDSAAAASNDAGESGFDNEDDKEEEEEADVDGGGNGALDDSGVDGSSADGMEPFPDAFTSNARSNAL